MNINIRFFTHNSNEEKFLTELSGKDLPIPRVGDTLMLYVGEEQKLDNLEFFEVRKVSMGYEKFQCDENDPNTFTVEVMLDYQDGLEPWWEQ